MAEWETGIIYDWKDGDMANERQIAISTLRNQRRILEDHGYISSQIKRYGLEIQVNNWYDPRLPEYQVDNQVDSQVDNLLSTLNNQVDNEVYNEVDNQVDNEVDSQVSQILTPLQYNQDNKIIRIKDGKKKEYSQPNFISEFVTAVRVKFTNNDQAQAIKDLSEDYGEEVVLQAATWYGQNNPRNMGHALKSINTALSRGWNTGKKDSIEEHNKKVGEAFLNGN